MAEEDTVAAAVRSEVRQLRVLAENYKIQQRAVELAFFQVENARDVLFGPGSSQGQQSAGNAAALTQQLLTAQANLLRNQNQLYGTWINYVTVRYQVYRDLEQMPLDARGVWIDELAACGTPAADKRRESPKDGTDQRPPAGGADDALEQLPTPKLLPPAGDGPELETNP
jgi:hypothetical protein